MTEKNTVDTEIKQIEEIINRILVNKTYKTCDLPKILEINKRFEYVVEEIKNTRHKENLEDYLINYENLNLKYVEVEENKCKNIYTQDITLIFENFYVVHYFYGKVHIDRTYEGEYYFGIIKQMDNGLSHKFFEIDNKNYSDTWHKDVSLYIKDLPGIQNICVDFDVSVTKFLDDLNYCIEMVKTYN